MSLHELGEDEAKERMVVW